jgi:hypothetical protein
MLSTLTAIVAQSSEDASLIMSDIVPDDIDGGLDGVRPEPPPAPQAVRLAARPVTSALRSARGNILRCIFLPFRWFAMPRQGGLLLIASYSAVG